MNNVNEDKTEDFTELLNNTNQAKEEEVETLGNTFVNSNNDEFKELVRRRDYRSLDETTPIKKMKKKLKKWVYIVLIGIVLLIGLIIFLIANGNKKAAEDKKALIDEIKSHYSEYVKVDKDTPIYKYNSKDNKYTETGAIYKDAVIKLEEEKTINEETKYFHVKDQILEDYYIPYNTVSKSSKPEINTRHKNYLPFDKCIDIEKATLYLDDKELITINTSSGMTLPILINDYEGKYYVDYNDMLVSVKKEEVKEIKDYQINGEKNQSKITTFAYHRVYDTTDKCTDSYICIKKENFDKQMSYLKENNYFTLNLNELYMYLKGNLRIKKGVVITFDDGYLYKAADEVLSKYNLNGTMFVITADFSDYSVFKELKSIDVQSHTHNMHRNYVCSGGNQGGAILCAGKDNIVADLKKSNELLGVEPIGLAYPFYDYNDTAISALKEVGYKMAFVGRAGVMGKATPKVTDLYKIPRMTVYDFNQMNFNEWKGYL